MAPRARGDLLVAIGVLLVVVGLLATFAPASAPGVVPLRIVLGASGLVVALAGAALAAFGADLRRRAG